jgi:hypothetical protein
MTVFNRDLVLPAVPVTAVFFGDGLGNSLVSAVALRPKRFGT